MFRRHLAIVALLSALPLVVRAQPNAGVSDERVSLPQAPGSVSGVGENASVEGNHGGFQYRVPVEVPPGFPGLTPDVSLSYSSMGGASLVGMGWGFDQPAIERMTVRGLPKYDLTDRFAVDGASELVQVASSAQGPVFRARFEGGFVRYTWLAAGAGEGGAWKAEYPDGRVGWFGADKQGVAVPSAQVTASATRVFRWHLVLLEDVYGHQQRRSYTKDASGMPLLERIDYLFEGANARHSVRFTYEDRSDVLSDAQPGVEVKLTKRLKELGIYSGTTTPEQVRRYALEYEPDTVSGFSTRLRSVTRFGRSGSAYPVKFSFGYTKTLGGLCDTTCDKPFVHAMGTVAGVDFANGRASMVDMNGDAIPDIVLSDAQGRHQFIYGRLDREGRASFQSAPVASARTAMGSPFVLGDPKVQLIDVNGDGFVDLTQAKVPAVLCNDGSGDWVDSTVCATAPQGLPSAFNPEDDVSEGAQQDPKYVRFFDYDNDKRIDWLRTPAGGTQTEVLANEPAGFRAVAVDVIGAVFDDEDLQLADMNGDGLQDPVRLRGKGTATLSVDFKVNLGFGRWAPAAPNWRTITVGGLNPTQSAQAELEDLNGDGLADVVMVAANEVHLLLNRNGDSFSAPLILTSASLASGTVPTRGPGTTVTYADMNGNGSADIVWFASGSPAQYLELFPVRPNLISRIENGLGSVQLIGFGTSISEQARDVAASRPWPTRVPNASILVTSVDSYVTLTGTASGGLHERMVYRYHDGFYDGVERQFRGYETVDRELVSDVMRDAQEPGLTVERFDVGRTEPALAGVLKTRTISALSGTTLVPLREERLLYQLCPVAETGTSAVKWPCQRATTTVLLERTPADAVTVRSEQEYDGYGNVTRSTNLGVVNLGTPEMPRACQACMASGTFGKACGDMCLGDESYGETTYIAPGADTGGRWMLSRASRSRSGAQAGMLNVETQTFYDGPAFVGLAAGQLTLGAVTRVSQRTGMGAMDFIDTLRVRRDAHGNVAEQLEPHGTLAGSSHRRLYTYEPAGLRPTQVEVKLSATRSLRRDTTWDYAFEQVAQASNWYAVEGGMNLAAPQQTRYRYDEHARLDRMLEPGDTDTTASTEYQYLLADPASRILTLKRSSATSGQDVVSAQCLDGRGRVFQTRQRITDTSWQVSGFTEFDSKGAAARVFQPYLSTSGMCEPAPPSGVPVLSRTYDVLGRPLVDTEPDQSTRRLEYAPLVTRTFDEDDTDMQSSSFNTPTIEESDGLGRLVRIERQQPSAVTQLAYDANGRLATVKDAAGNALVQQYDLAGRLVQTTNPNSGVTRFEYDAAGNLLRRVDARNVAVRTDYDALSRPVAQWDEAKEAATKVRWAYDAVAGCTECTNAGGQAVETEWPMPGGTGRDRFGFDVRQDAVFFERTVDGKPLVVRTRFDQAHRPTAIVYPAGLTVETAYDGASRVASMPNLVRSLEYDARGLTAATTYVNNVAHRFEYDARLRLTRQTATIPGGQAIFDLAFTRTRAGNLTAITDAATRMERARHAVRFTSDGWDRVTSAVMERAVGDAETLSFAYDTIDNVTSQSSSLGDASLANAGAYTYDAAKPNAVKKAGALEYQYDAAGFMTARGSAGYTFDHLGRLTRATRDGTETGSFVFGAGPMRVLEREGGLSSQVVTGDFEVRDGIAVVYARLGGKRVARLESDAVAATLLSDLAPLSGTTPTGDGTIDIADAWVAQSAATGGLSLSGGPAPSSVQALLASAARRLLLKDVTWLHSDHQGSLVAATDGKGALVAEQSFYPWGEVRSSTGFVDSHGFTGQERDSSTGLVHFLYRDLDPKTGRWASVDPAFAQLSPGAARNEESLTAYAYVGNDFADKVDPTGLAGNKARPGQSKATRARNKAIADRNARTHADPVLAKVGLKHTTEWNVTAKPSRAQWGEVREQGTRMQQRLGASARDPAPGDPPTVASPPRPQLSAEQANALGFELFQAWNQLNAGWASFTPESADFVAETNPYGQWAEPDPFTQMRAMDVVEPSRVRPPPQAKAPNAQAAPAAAEGAANNYGRSPGVPAAAPTAIYGVTR